ncbi:MAG: hypothetical protein ABJL67_09295 [Sulfitobacter sp.]
MATDLTDENIAQQRDARQQLERDDYNNAIAGRETGRMMRFGAKSKDEREAKQRKAERVFRDALDRLMQDAEYRALYEQLGENLSDAERNADHTIAAIQAALRKLEDDIADMDARAGRTLDGKSVFRTADGRVINEDGEELPPEIAEGIQWPPNAPTAEEYFGAKERHGDLAAGLEEWQGYRNDTLGGIRDRYEDRENPQAIEGLENDLNLIAEDAPSVPASLNGMIKTVDVTAPSAALIPTLPGS